MWAKRQAALINRVLDGGYKFDVLKVARGIVSADGGQHGQFENLVNSILSEVRK